MILKLTKFGIENGTQVIRIKKVISKIGLPVAAISYQKKILYIIGNALIKRLKYKYFLFILFFEKMSRSIIAVKKQNGKEVKRNKEAI
jgi:hypothetical protein